MYFNRVYELTDDDLIPVKDDRRGNSGVDRWISPFYLGANIVGRTPTSNVLWVMAEGDDTTALRARMDRPFASLVAAKNAAFAGDTIHVFAGTHTVSNGDQLLKNLVNWHFYAGSTVNKTSTDITTGNAYGIFDDRAFGSTAVTCKITGHADFFFDAGVPVSDGFGSAAFSNANFRGLFYLNNANSDVEFEASRIQVRSFHTFPDVYGIWVSNCKRCATRIPYIFDKHFGETVQIPDPGGPITLRSRAFGVYWELGDLWTFFNHIKVAGYGLYGSQPAGAGHNADWWIEGDVVQSGDQVAVYNNGPGASLNWKTWLTVKELEGNATGGGGNTAGGYTILGSGRHYILKAGKISGVFGIDIGQNGALAPEVWLNVQKVSANSAQGFKIAGASSKVWGEVLEIADGGTMTVGIEIHNASECHLSGRSIKTLNGKGVVHNGGNSFIEGFRIDTSNTDNVANRPVEVSAAGLRLRQCILVAPALADSVYAAAAQNIRAYGCHVNRAMNGNVTDLITGGMTVDADVL